MRGVMETLCIWVYLEKEKEMQQGGENCREEREITVIVSEKLQGNIIL